VEDFASVAIVTARVAQSLVHVCLPQTSHVVAVRFTFLMVQLLGFATLIACIARNAVV
jgi:hypothetical protein